MCHPPLQTRSVPSPGFAVSSPRVAGVLFLAAFLSCWPAREIRAQDLRALDPSAIQKRSEETMDYHRVDRKLQEKKEVEAESITDKTRETPRPAPRDDSRFLLQTTVTDSSEILTEEEIRSVTSRYEAREVGIGNLMEIVEAINELCQRKHYLTAKAFLPPQQVQDGVVRIQLIEGHVGRLVIENNHHTRDSYFSRRISLRPGSLVRLDELEKELRSLHRTNDLSWSQKYLSMIFMHPNRTMPRKFSTWYS